MSTEPTATPSNKKCNTICISVKKGISCKNAGNCRFADNLEQFAPGDCKKGDKCQFKNTCWFCHPGETPANVWKRLTNLPGNSKIHISKPHAKIERLESHDGLEVKSPKKVINLDKKKTKPCDSIRTTGQCKFSKKCLFAHSFKELKPVQCIKGTACQNRDCLFQHPDETPLAYSSRVKLPFE